MARLILATVLAVVVGVPGAAAVMGAGCETKCGSAKFFKVGTGMGEIPKAVVINSLMYDQIIGCKRIWRTSVVEDDLAAGGSLVRRSREVIANFTAFCDPNGGVYGAYFDDGEPVTLGIVRDTLTCWSECKPDES